MPQIALSFHNGIANSNDELRMSEGFARVLRGLYLKASDPDRLWKIPQRTLLGTLPSATTNYGLDYAKYDIAAYILALANSKIYRIPASRTALAATALADAQGSPVDYARTGTYLKSMHDGVGNFLIWDGSGSRALVMDKDGNARLYGMDKPGSAPTLSSSLSSAGTDVRPTASTGSGFSPVGNAIDTDDATAATATLSAAGTATTTWTTFPATAVSGHVLQVYVATSSRPPQTSSGLEGGGDGTTEDVVARLKIEVSQDSGGSFTTIFDGSAPVSQRWVNYNLTVATNLNTVQVRATLTYTSGTQQCSGLVYDIKASNAGSNAVPLGTYFYAITEVFERTLSDGKVIRRESAPSDLAEVVVNSTVYGIVLNLPNRANADSEGYPATISGATSLWRRVYRSSSTGAWPNLGLIADNVPITDSTTFTDTFSISGDTVPTPPLAVVQVGASYYPANATPNPIIDATLFRGAVVTIPEHDPRRLQWSLGGSPESVPVIHDYTLIPSERNDELVGILAINEVLIVWARTQTYRLSNLPFSTQSLFDLAGLKIDILSPNEGLVSPRGYTVVQTQKGFPVAFWISDTGIWMTDGSLFELRGTGAVKLSTWLDWETEVDTTQLSACYLVFDPILQVVRFSYISARDGDRYELWLHTAAHHWVPSGQDQLVPKITGPHPLRAQDYAVGVLSSRDRMWSLDSTSTGKVFNEQEGFRDAAGWVYGNGDSEAYIESGWYYPGGPLGAVHLYEGTLYHSDWGSPQSVAVETQTRRDESGVLQVATKRISLAGGRLTRFWIDRAGQSFRVLARHLGQVTGAFGPIVLDGESTGDIEEV